MTMLKVVLLANGIGSDPATYRPESDESQWWNRRDALVRCVTAFFFGYLPDDSGGANDDSRPPSQDSLQWPDGGSCQKELHIVFDEDWSTFCMTLSSSRPRATSSRNNRGRSKAATSAEDTEFVPLKVPTERNIVALWKRSAAHPGECIEQDGLLCRMIVSKTIHPTSLTSPVATSASQVFGSKRELVEHLQSTCSMDFLREHKLNSSLETILRKSNMKALLDVKKDWERNHGKKPRLQAPVADKSDRAAGHATAPLSTADSGLEDIMERVLQPSSPTISQVIAATLHESSSNELPCWDDDLLLATAGADDITSTNESLSSLQICLFLGAVRDMLKTENRSLRQVCTKLSRRHNQPKQQKPRPKQHSSSQYKSIGEIPLLRIRIGPVSEFTSKILTVVAFHHACHRLGPACRRLCQLQSLQKQQPTPSLTASGLSSVPSTPRLHFVCLVAASSEIVSAKLVDRNVVLWNMVRCTVTALWRSRLAGKNQVETTASTAPLLFPVQRVPVNVVTFVFTNNVVLTLFQDDIVKAMAEQHQAAPTEHQVLALIHSKLDLSNGVSTTWDQFWKLEQQSQRTTCLVDFIVERATTQSAAAPSALDSFYGTTPNMANGRPSSWLILLPILPNAARPTSTDTAGTPKGSDEFYRRLRITAQSDKIASLHGREIVDVGPCVDHIGATVTLIQHLCYQGRLQGLPATEQ